jgi:peptidoglycan/xylan/chitin deacetylase (PgdA/CDA1 family)
MIAAKLDRQHLQRDLNALPTQDAAAEYQLKRLLKYEISAEDRDRALALAFEEVGGVEGELARSVYLGPDECRALDAAGVELGAHTVNHLVLSSLEPSHQRREIEGSLRDLESWLGHGVSSFAYPYGRTWDYDENTLDVLEELGFKSAITAMPGLNDADTPRMELRRFAVNQDGSLAELLCEVDGVFDWLAQRGVSLRP